MVTDQEREIATLRDALSLISSGPIGFQGKEFTWAQVVANRALRGEWTGEVRDIVPETADTERQAIVAWLRGQAGKWHGVHPHTGDCLAYMIERGQHRVEPS